MSRPRPPDKKIQQAIDTLGDEFAFFFDLIHAQLQRLDLDEGARVLDVGTGKGAAAVTLALCGHQVLTGEPADDHSEYARQAWRERARKAGVERAITFEPFAAERMPFADGAFDAVFVHGALHHVQDPAAAVAECIRVLAPAGAFCILEPNAAMVASLRAEHPDHPEPIDPTPFVPGTFALETVHEEKFDVYLIRRAL